MSLSALDNLKGILAKVPSAIIAFSGGVDSTFLARAAADSISGKVLLVTAVSSTYPEEELVQSKQLAALIGLEQQIIVSEELDIPGFAENTPQRCYFCKKGLFSEILAIAKERGIDTVFDGNNVDDSADYRPGRKAIRELGVRSPLAEAGFTKQMVREYSAQYKLPTASKPSNACLASRFPYGETITKDKLSRVHAAEKALRDAGFSGFRVRSHGNCARIELAPSEMDRGWQQRDILDSACRTAGFVFVSIDVRGYRTGALNEVLSL
jgi:pyridinium-3,5-biscarboxylic acid mononucleotide sulfurtransferase